MAFAKDVMTRDVITIHTHATLFEAVELLLDRRISGVPVVDDEHHLVGIISEFALLTLAYAKEARDDIVLQHMTRHVISVEEHTLLSDVADLFILNRVRRVPVTNDKKLTGIISRRDLLRRCHENEHCFARPEIMVSRQLAQK